MRSTAFVDKDVRLKQEANVNDVVSGLSGLMAYCLETSVGNTTIVQVLQTLSNIPQLSSRSVRRLT